ncbi:hypothetical protein RJ640_003091 [Escallonia rubra]|uniref:Uncharacterized protein n=1 Tax=Escallonia rubra TaxID=112253 RepID=A0AA88UDJ2_9ASTE|nr:hypothetical protein RJ640_003091 [Escallonia rubra]
MVARELTATVIEPEEEVVTSWNYRFARIGHSVPIKPSHAHSQFDPTAPPSRPLAVSQRFGVLIVAHSTGTALVINIFFFFFLFCLAYVIDFCCCCLGFCVARTKDVMESAEKGGSGLSIQELSLVDLDIGKVSILALSPDSSTLAASIGSHLHLFSVTALLNKEWKPSLSCYLDDSSCIKDMRWAPTVEEHYVVLSIDGKLYHGAAHEHLKDVMDNVDADDNELNTVEWSEADNFVAVAKKNVLSILSSEFKERLSISLSLKSFDDESDANCIMKGGSVQIVSLLDALK